MTVIRMRDYGSRVRAGLHAQRVHDQIAQPLKASDRVRLDFTDVESVGATFLDRCLGALVAWHGTTVLRSLVFGIVRSGVLARDSDFVGAGTGESLDPTVTKVDGRRSPPSTPVAA